MADTNEIFGESEVLLNAKTWYEKNKKSVWIIGASIVLIVGGFLAWRYMKSAKEEKAAVMLYTNGPATNNSPLSLYFQDSINAAVNAQGNGLYKITKDYDGTKAGEISQFALGMSYLKLGKENEANYNNAIKVLKQVDFGDEDIAIKTEALGAIGDAYWELGDLKNAKSFYSKAAKRFPNPALTPIFLHKRAMVEEEMKSWKSVLGTYQKIEKDYPDYFIREGLKKDKLRAEYSVK